MYLTIVIFNIIMHVLNYLKICIKVNLWNFLVQIKLSSYTYDFL